ncbi:MAG: hypothetical protein C0593_02610 [Marinilabiliales bacterium]|nr:MAG: hypothetical protein C0593_02610 [Marinilabiliales bacterium]
MQIELKDLILVPVDFTETSENAIMHAAKLAATMQYSVHLFHVINRESQRELRKKDEDRGDLTERLTALGEKYIAPENVAFEVSTHEGSIYSEIEEALISEGAKLMVMGTHGKKGLQFIFGSDALKVVTKSPVPVIVVQDRDFDEGYNRIVFPVNDFTENRQQVQWAVHIAKIFDSEILVFVQKEADSGMETKMSIVTQQIAESFDEEKIKYRIFESEKVSNYTEQLLEFAAEERADLITIMTDSDAYSPDFPIAGWDEKLMFNPMQIPILCINPKELNQVYFRYVGIL